MRDIRIPKTENEPIKGPMSRPRIGDVIQINEVASSFKPSNFITGVTETISNE